MADEKQLAVREVRIQAAAERRAMLTEIADQETLIDEIAARMAEIVEDIRDEQNSLISPAN